MIPYTSPDRGTYARLHMDSCYVTMRDGVRLAVEIIRPTPSKGQRLPVLLHQTRYWRMPELRAPFGMLSDGLLSHLGQMVREIVKSGYVVVSVDCRGSGASFGTQPFPWAPDEVEDGRDMVEWILKQEWCNGRLGTLGVSYTGTAAEFLASLAHPAVKAAMPLFSLYDVYDDIAVPGGVPNDGFVKEWGRANSELDANRIPIFDPMATLLVRGVRPVGGRKGRAELDKAIQEHAGNLHVNKTSEGVIYRDQPSPNGVVQTMDEFSPHTVTQKINASGIAVYSGSGWMDGAYPHSSIRRFLNLKTPVNKLLLGPWDHGAKFHITPGKARKTGPELAGEAIKFFDHYVKGYATGLDKEPKVRYYTMQAEEWRSAETWPPPGTAPMRLNLHPKNGLSQEIPAPQAGSLTLQHSASTGTGEYTRWRGLLGRARTGHLYPDRKLKDAVLAIWESAPLEADTEVTGHPWVQAWLRTQESDGALYAYLEDVTKGGEVWYVTEGHRRMTHRSNHAPSQPYQDAVPTPSYNREEAQAIPKGEAFLLAFDLLPTSYLFRKGHKIRLVLATGDKDNFQPLCKDGAKYELLLGADHGCWVELPIMARG